MSLSLSLDALSRETMLGRLCVKVIAVVTCFKEIQVGFLLRTK